MTRATPTSRPAAAKTTKATKKPTVHFSVAAAEREHALEEIEPFTVEHPAGNVVTFRDPRTLGYIEASSLDPRNAIQLFSALIEDRDAYMQFVSEDIPQPVVKEMFDAYQEHYGVTDLGN
jgi:hypothetical protein